MAATGRGAAAEPSRPAGTLRFAPVPRTASGRGAQAVIDSLRRLGADERMIEAAKNGHAPSRRTR
jgi:hypothetical protein